METPCPIFISMLRSMQSNKVQGSRGVAAYPMALHTAKPAYLGNPSPSNCFRTVERLPSAHIRSFACSVLPFCTPVPDILLRLSLLAHNTVFEIQRRTKGSIIDHDWLWRKILHLSVLHEYDSIVMRGLSAEH